MESWAGVLVDADACAAFVAGVSLAVRMLAVNGLREDDGVCGLASPPGAREQIGCGEAIVGHGLTEVLDDGVLADDLIPCLGAVLLIKLHVRVLILFLVRAAHVVDCTRFLVESSARTHLIQFHPCLTHPAKG